MRKTLAWAHIEDGELARAEQPARAAVGRAVQMGAWFRGVSARRMQGMVVAPLSRYDAADAA